MSNVPTGEATDWRPEPGPWGRADLLAVIVWTVAIAAFFWDAVSLTKALFYFDITEINYPYRDFFARELRAGRFSRWCPGLYYGLPLYSESQAGYLHPLKYLLYPWMATWKAFNLDTTLSVWLTGLGTYGWLRRHVRPAGALAGGAVFGLGGFVWAHFIHTSMINALASVPFAFWAVEAAWDGGRVRPVVLGAVALASQVFAGHLQDTILTVGALGLYTLYRAATERGWRRRASVLGLAAGLVALAGMLAAVQWIPSKELLDRSPRSSGLTWDELTYGSWSPELLPALLVREAYGTRARDTDWMDGFYPYHEMDSYLGIIAIGLAIVGGAAYRDRWVAFWVILAGIGGVLMLGRYTFLFDFAHRVPVFGSSRIPVRYHLWVSLAVAALAGVGVDRLARPGTVRLRSAAVTIGLLFVASLPILAYAYAPVWTEPKRWPSAYHGLRYRWLSRELIIACARTTVLVALAWRIARLACLAPSPTRRVRLAALLPLLIITDLLGAHIVDVPTVAPAYWTVPPASARALRSDPSFVRVFGQPLRSAGEPGFASEPVDFLAIRDGLGWSLPPVWGLASARGETPIVPRRRLTYSDHVGPVATQLGLAAVTHYVTDIRGESSRSQGLKAGHARIYRIPDAFPRARLVGRPIYADDEAGAIAAVTHHRATLRERPIIEDPGRPLPEAARVSGTARIVREVPERVEVETKSDTPSYLILADTFDPGWSATVDGRPAPIRPAYITFRAVFLPTGRHTVVFRYRPAGFALGLGISVAGAIVSLVLLLADPRLATPQPEHSTLSWPSRWPLWGMAALGVIVLLSTFQVDPHGRITHQNRWNRSFHRFTWGAGVEAIRR